MYKGRSHSWDASLIFSTTAAERVLLSHHLEMPVIAGIVSDVDELVADRGHHVDHALVTDERGAVQVDPVEDREAEAEQRDLGVPGNELGVGIADDGIHRIGHDQAAQVPEVLVDVDLAVLAVGRGIQQRLNLLLQLLAPPAAEDVVRPGTHFQEEGYVAQQVIRVAVNGELLVVDVLVGVGHGVHCPAPLRLDGFGNLLAEQTRRPS